MPDRNLNIQQQQAQPRKNEAKKYKRQGGGFLRFNRCSYCCQYT